MSKTINNIGNLINFLPTRDLKLGDEFFKSRNFDALKELVDSALIKTQKNVRQENAKQEYLDVNISKLLFLKAEVDIYILQLELPETEYNYGDSESSFWPD